MGYQKTKWILYKTIVHPHRFRKNIEMQDEMHDIRKANER